MIQFQLNIYRYLHYQRESVIVKCEKKEKMYGGGNAWMKLIGIKDKKRGRKDKKENEQVG